jgi:hypothetical protein
MLQLRGLGSAEKFVTAQADAGNDVRWVGFDKIVFFRPDPRGMSAKAGAFRNGQWGFDNVVEVNGSGVWEVDYRNVKRIKRSRH